MDHESLFWGLIHGRIKQGRVVDEEVVEDCHRQAINISIWAANSFARYAAEQEATAKSKSEGFPRAKPEDNPDDKPTPADKPSKAKK